MGKYFLQTFGCQMNKNDSERIAGLLEYLGLSSTKKVAEADLIIVNTCSVRQSAEDRVYGLICNWRELKKTNPKLIIAVTGCLPGRDKNGKIKKKISDIDWFFPITDLPLLPRLIKQLNPDLLVGTDKWSSDIGETTADYLQITPKGVEHFRKFVTIQTGCNGFCTYCVVPYARGREKNRPVKDILLEIKNFAENGCQEVTLLGQVVNSYQAPDKHNFAVGNPFKSQDDFAALLWEVNQIDGLRRIHFTAPDPYYFNNAQVESLCLPKQANYLHLPVQSGNNEILKKMNRKYTKEEYVVLIDKIKRFKPKIALGTDLIVGFCGETDDQFQETLDLYRYCEFDISYPAMYSQRSGTVASKIFKDDVPYTIKKQRWQSVQDLMEKIAYIKNQTYVNQVVSVLVEEHTKQGTYMGRTNEMKLVRFFGGKDFVGKIVDIHIYQADVWILEGRIAK